MKDDIFQSLMDSFCNHEDFHRFLKSIGATIPYNNLIGQVIPLSEVQKKDFVLEVSLATGGVEMDRRVKVSDVGIRYEVVTGDPYKVIFAGGEWYDSRTGEPLEKKMGTYWIEPTRQPEKPKVE